MADDFDSDFPVPQEYAFPPAEMILELAKGLEDPVDIAERYGYNAIQYAALENWEPFRKEYERMVNKLEVEGVTYRNKAILYATDLIDRVFAAAKRPNVPLSQLIDAQKLMSKAGDLDPKTAVNINTTSTVVYEIVRDEPNGVSSEIYESTAVHVADEADEAKDKLLPNPDSAPEEPV